MREPPAPGLIINVGGQGEIAFAIDPDKLGFTSATVTGRLSPRRKTMTATGNNTSRPVAPELEAVANFLLAHPPPVHRSAMTAW
ncbi:MAG TPA: hypothetical protein VGQ80_12445, partial [Acidimicrobiia bacterium]|nr:hypothetical protein [Acidimicrobiia bacterium]